jgi:hypothetical protein
MSGSSSSLMRRKMKTNKLMAPVAMASPGNSSQRPLHRAMVSSHAGEALYATSLSRTRSRTPWRRRRRP